MHCLAKDKTFVGAGWSNKIDGVNISVKLEEIKKLTPNKYGDIFLEVNPRRNPDEKTGATHYVSVNEYKHGEAAAPSPQKESRPQKQDDKEDLPF